MSELRQPFRTEHRHRLPVLRFMHRTFPASIFDLRNSLGSDPAGNGALHIRRSGASIHRSESARWHLAIPSKRRLKLSLYATANFGLPRNLRGISCGRSETWSLE